MHKNYYKWLGNRMTTSHLLGEIRTFQVAKILLLAGQTLRQGLWWQRACVRKKAEPLLRGELRLPAAPQGFLATIGPGGRSALIAAGGSERHSGGGISRTRWLMGAEGGGWSTGSDDPTCIPARAVRWLVVLPTDGWSAGNGTGACGGSAGGGSLVAIIVAVSAVIAR